MEVSAQQVSITKEMLIKLGLLDKQIYTKQFELNRWLFQK